MKVYMAPYILSFQLSNPARTLRRLAAVRRAARKAQDPDMKKLWHNHAEYFLRQKGGSPKRYGTV
jgi:hypothetical protein